jgi:hypothetical protein
LLVGHFWNVARIDLVIGKHGSASSSLRISGVVLDVGEKILFI